LIPKESLADAKTSEWKCDEQKIIKCLNFKLSHRIYSIITKENNITLHGDSGCVTQLPKAITKYLR
jgi:hypothetical protein